MSYIKDTNHCLSKFEFPGKIPENAFLVSADVADITRYDPSITLR